MSRIQFNQIFFAVMTLAFACAFVLPAQATDHFKIQVSGIFAPLSHPARIVAGSVYGEFISKKVEDDRAAADVVAENQWLKSELLNLQANLTRLQRIEAESQTLGDLRSNCIRAPVVGSDAGTRDSLILSPSVGRQVHDNAPAVYDGGLAGRVVTGIGGARLRLITDLGMSVTARFIRLSQQNGKLVETAIPDLQPLVQGAGQGKLIIRDIKKQQVKDTLKLGDWAVVDDPEYPDSMQGWRIGQITEAHESRQAPGFVEISLMPQSPLNRLSDVWVLKDSK